MGVADINLPQGAPCKFSQKECYSCIAVETWQHWPHQTQNLQKALLNLDLNLYLMNLLPTNAVNSFSSNTSLCVAVLPRRKPLSMLTKQNAWLSHDFYFLGPISMSWVPSEGRVFAARARGVRVKMASKICPLRVCLHRVLKQNMFGQNVCGGNFLNVVERMILWEPSIYKSTNKNSIQSPNLTD